MRSSSTLSPGPRCRSQRRTPELIRRHYAQTEPGGHTPHRPHPTHIQKRHQIHHILLRPITHEPPSRSNNPQDNTHARLGAGGTNVPKKSPDTSPHIPHPTFQRQCRPAPLNTCFQLGPSRPLCFFAPSLLSPATVGREGWGWVGVGMGGGEQGLRHFKSW